MKRSNSVMPCRFAKRFETIDSSSRIAITQQDGPTGTDVTRETRNALRRRRSQTDRRNDDALPVEPGKVAIWAMSCPLGRRRRPPPSHHGVGAAADTPASTTAPRDLSFWTWDTEEVLTMIQWMRAFNQSGKGRVQFTGFDMQTPTVAAENVQKFVAKHEPAYLTAVTDATTAATRSSAARRPAVWRCHRFVPDCPSRREEGAVPRLHQNGRCHARGCGSVVARRRPFRGSGLRQHADAGRDRHDRLGTAHDSSWPSTPV